MNISEVTTKNTSRGKHIVIYSIGGVGKTTLGATFANTENGLMLLTGEDGLSPINIEAPHIKLGCNVNIEDKDAMSKVYTDYLDIIKQLIIEKHNYKWLIQDPFSHLIKNSFEAYIVKNYYDGDSKKANSYGSKYQEYQTEFNKLIEAFKALLNKGMNILSLCHGIVIDYKDPSMEAYKKWELDLPIGNKVNLAANFYNHADGVFFGCFDVVVDEKHKASGGVKRILRTSVNAPYSVKNMRLPTGKTLPDPILFDANILKDQLIKGGAIVSIS